MITLSIAGLIICFVLIAALLLSLNLYSKFPWTVKAAGIIIVSSFYLVSYFSFPPLLGWPTKDDLPKRFKLIGAHVSEPNKISGSEGEIYLWVTDMTPGNNNERPRSYRLPFNQDLHAKVIEAKSKLGKKLPQLGEINDDEVTKTKPTDETRGGQTTTNLEFFDLPDPLFPEK